MSLLFSTVGIKKNFLWTKKSFLTNFFLIFGFDKFFRLWNPKFFFLKTKRYLGHQKIILNLCGSKKTNNLITCSNDNFIKFWDLFSSRPLRSIQIKFDLIQCVELNIHRQILICLGKETLTLWDIYKGNCFTSLYFSPNFRPSIGFMKNCEIFCIPQFDNVLVFFDIKNASILKKFYLEKKNIFMEWCSKSSLIFFFKKIIFLPVLNKFFENKRIFLFPWILKKKNNFQIISSEDNYSKNFKTKKVLKFFKKENSVRILDIKTSLFLLNN